MKTLIVHLAPCTLILFVMTTGGCDLDDPNDPTAAAGMDDELDLEPTAFAAVEPPPPEQLDEYDEALRVAAAPQEPSQLGIQGWSSYTSEEYLYAYCGSSMVNGTQCQGSYCDNIRLYCQSSGLSANGTAWTTYFSEEGTNYRYCPAGSWVTGLSCKGSNCDNIALQCIYFNATPKNCYWTGWMSEENGGQLFFGAGYFVRGAQCSGSYCDNKRYYVCQK